MNKSPLYLALLFSLMIAGAACKSVGGSDSISDNPGRIRPRLPYESPDGRFSLTLPPGFTEFEPQSFEKETPAGKIELTILQSENPRGSCVVASTNFPPTTFDERAPQKLLEDARDAALKNLNAALEKQENITVQGRQGLAVYGSAEVQGKQLYVRFHFILDRPRAYQIGYLSHDRSALDRPDVQAYFDSFRLSDPAASSGAETKQQELLALALRKIRGRSIVHRSN